MTDRRSASSDDAAASSEATDSENGRERPDGAGDDAGSGDDAGERRGNVDEGGDGDEREADGSDEVDGEGKADTTASPGFDSGSGSVDADMEGAGSTEERSDEGSGDDRDIGRDSAVDTGNTGDTGDTGDTRGDDEELESLREAVEAEYDFEDFGPEEMAEMSYEEWEAVFDHESWITGTELLDRVEADLRGRIVDREVFARIERLAADPAENEPERLLAYSDEGYALVFPDGSIDGQGTVLRDVKPTVALCSMDEYDVAEPPEDGGLPAPSAVPEGSGELGNFMLQITATIQLLAGVGLLIAWIALDVETILAPVVGLGFVLAGAFLFLVVANARLSDRFRAEEYRNRLRAVGLESGERPDFLPIESEDPEDFEDDSGSDSTT